MADHIPPIEQNFLEHLLKYRRTVYVGKMKIKGGYRYSVATYAEFFDRTSYTLAYIVKAKIKVASN